MFVQGTECIDVIELNNALGGLTNTLDGAEDSISKIKAMTIESFKAKKQRVKDHPIQYKNWRKTMKSVACITELQQEDRQEGPFKARMTENFTQVNVRHQTTDPDAREEQTKC